MPCVDVNVKPIVQTLLLSAVAIILLYVVRMYSTQRHTEQQSEVQGTV